MHENFPGQKTLHCGLSGANAAPLTAGTLPTKRPTPNKKLKTKPK